MLSDVLQLYPSGSQILERSEGCCQYDSTGKKYIDFESGVWCANIGHNHPEIARVIKKYAQKSIHSGYRFRVEESERLSVALQQRAGFENGSAFFLSSGSEAVNLSITLAQHLTGRKKILKINNSYLSAYGVGRNAADNSDAVSVEFNNLEDIDRIDYSEIGALVLEVGGASIDIVQFPEQIFVEALVAKAKENKCVIIAEEVTTGMGRLGRWFGFQNYAIQPDMVVAGKALGNGYPISAILVAKHIKDTFNKTPFVYGQSHQNDPLGCAVGLAVLDVIEKESLLDRSIEIGSYFNESLQKLKAKYPQVIKEVRAKGLMLAIEFHGEIGGKSIADSLFLEGFIVGFKKNSIRFMPPLVIEEEYICQLISCLDSILMPKT